jgi:hypothetical protein
MTGFDERDATTSMQNDQRRESELYRRIFRQQSRASRKGDVDAGLGALQTLAASRAAGFDPTGISSAEGNRDFAAGSLANLNEQTAMAEGERQAAPVSGATGIPEVPGMQQAPPASLADSFETKAGKVMGSKLGSRPDADGSLFARLTGVDPNAGDLSVGGGRSVSFSTGSGEGSLYDSDGSVIGSSRPSGEPAPSSTPSLSEEFAKQFPLSSKLIGSTLTKNPERYDPSTDPTLTSFKEDEKKYGREEAMRRAQEGPRSKARGDYLNTSEGGAIKRGKTLAKMAEAREQANRPPILEDELFSADSDYLSNPSDIAWRDFQRSEKEKEMMRAKELREQEEMSVFLRKLDRDAKKRGIFSR